jgi:hypothetical protein
MNRKASPAAMPAHTHGTLNHRTSGEGTNAVPKHGRRFASPVKSNYQGLRREEVPD